MNDRILLAILVGLSLVLAVIVSSRQAVNVKRKQTLTMLENLPKAERDRFHSNAVEFYQNNSRAAREERKRLRDLYYRIQNDPASEHLKKTLQQYVDWVSRSNPATMRVFQSQSDEARVEAIHQAVLEEQRQFNTTEPLITIERLKDMIRENLPTELQSLDFNLLSHVFDRWVSQKYDEAKSTLPYEKLTQLSEIETFYRNLFRHAGMEISSTETLEIPEKLTMLQFIQNLSPRQGGVGGGIPSRLIGGARMGGGGYFYVRPGGGPPFGLFGSSGLRDDFFEQFESILLDKIDPSSRQSLARMNRQLRTETLQRILALAILEQHPAIDTGRFFQASSRMEQQEWVDILGIYLSLMSLEKREEFLTQDSRSTLNRLQGELLSHSMAYFGLFRIRPPDNRPPGMGPPSSPRRDPSSEIVPTRPRPGDGLDRERGREQGRGQQEQEQSPQRGQG